MFFHLFLPVTLTLFLLFQLCFSHMPTVVLFLNHQHADRLWWFISSIFEGFINMLYCIRYACIDALCDKKEQLGHILTVMKNIEDVGKGFPHSHSILRVQEGDNMLEGVFMGAEFVIDVFRELVCWCPLIYMVEYGQPSQVYFSQVSILISTAQLIHQHKHPITYPHQQLQTTLQLSFL